MTRPLSLLAFILALVPNTDSLASTLLVGAPLATIGADLEVRTDRSRVSVGESFQLLVRYRGTRPTTPDLKTLDGDFEILDVQQSSRTSIVNGMRDQSLDWTVTLTARREGTFKIPSFRVGSDSSNALKIEVGAARNGRTASPGAPMRLEVEVDNAEPYVQGKVTVTARVFLDDSIRDGALGDPALEGALIERLGEDTSYQTELDGKLYSVVERRYAVFPQASGAVMIPPLVFEGTQRNSSRNTRSPFDDFFGNDPFASSSSSSSSIMRMSGMFDRGRRMRTQSEAIQLDVQPRPDSTDGGWFLPARHVELFEEWSEESPTFQVGEQVVRTLGIQAVGLSGDQLPDLTLPAVSGIKQYPEQAQNRTFVNDGETVAVRVQRVPIIPTDAGDLTLPALELTWWDTEADTRRTANLPEQTIHVLPATGVAAVTNNATADPPTQTVAANSDEAVPNTDSSSRDAGFDWTAWGPLLGMISLCGFGAALVVRRRRKDMPADRSAKSHVEPLGPSETALRKACFAGDAAVAARALVRAGRARDQNVSIRNVGDVASVFSNDRLTDAIHKLTMAAYSQEKTAWSGKSLWEAYRKCRRRRGPSTASREALPALYPTN
jgi:hypothetical protein